MRFHLLPVTVLVCALACVGSPVRAQFLQDTAATLARSLVKSGVDTVLIFEPYSNYRMSSDSSYVWDIRYVMSKQGGKLVVERLTSEYVDNRGHIFTYNKVVKQDTLHVFRFLKEHFMPIFSDTLLPAMIKYRMDGKDSVERLVSFHRSHTQLVVLTKGGAYSNGFIDGDLYDGIIKNDDGSIRDRFESVNYEYNISTSIYKIITLLHLVIADISRVYKY